MSNPWHPDESQLLAYADAELERGQIPAVEEHLAACSECHQRVARMRAALDGYDRHYVSARAKLPAPPQPWANLRVRLNELDAGRVQSRRRVFPRVNYRWVAAAAALIIGVFVFRVSTEQTVSAAGLLQKASVQEARSARPKNIRVKTKKSQWVRPAAGPAQWKEEAEIGLLFQGAKFNWDEPLSARSFSQWRDALASKDDNVKVLRDTDFGSGRFYLITTSTPEGTLAEASITLRAGDMRAVQETFQFRNSELVEITEETGTAQPLPAERLAQVRPGETARKDNPRTLTPSDELRVVAALHAIGADLGDPVEIARRPESGRIAVSALATDPERQQQIRAALAGLSYVDLTFEQPEAVRPSPRLERTSPERAQQSNAVQDRLSARLGGRGTAENFTNYVLDLSEAALARAHALRALAQRFPPNVESQLSQQDLKLLQGIQADHTKHLASSVRQIVDRLRPVASAGGVPATEPFATWQAGSEAVLAAAQRLDGSISETLAGPGKVVDPDEALTTLLRAASELQVRTAALQTTVARSGGG